MACYPSCLSEMDLDCCVRANLVLFNVEETNGLEPENLGNDMYSLDIVGGNVNDGK